jgi:hypothetical protein
MASTKELRQHTRMRLLLQAGMTDLQTLTAAVITAMTTKDAKEASKAFQALYFKSGAMESAAAAAKKINWHIAGQGSAVTSLRDMLAVIAGVFRESQGAVIGDTALADDQRRQDAIDLLNDLKDALAEAHAEDERSQAHYGRDKLAQYSA